MTTQSPARELPAILSAHVKAYRSRVADSPGGNVLAALFSAMDGVAEGE